MHPMILRVDLELGDRQEMDRENRYNLKMNYKVGNSVCRQCLVWGTPKSLGLQITLKMCSLSLSLCERVCVNLGQE